jgi:DNA-binding transcriptional ArsR family regulator
VLNQVGLVRCRADGRRRLYRLEPDRLQPFHEWLEKYERAWNDRLDRVEDYLKELQQQGDRQ